MTSSAVTGLPSENLVSRRWNVYTLRFGLTVQVARSGTTAFLESSFTRLPYIMFITMIDCESVTLAGSRVFGQLELGSKLGYCNTCDVARVREARACCEPAKPAAPSATVARANAAIARCVCFLRIMG